MRIAFNDKKLLTAEDGTLYGIALGYDHCAEHEFGIKGLADLFGLTYQGLGIRARTQQRPVSYERVSFTKDKQKWVILFVTARSVYVRPEEDRQKAMKNYALSQVGVPWRDDMQTAWDDNGFGICCKASDTAIIDLIANAIDNKRLVVGFKLSSEKGTPFDRGGGLMLCDADLVPQDVDERLSKTDDSNIRLHNAVLKTGIERKLMKAGCKYYALSPRWKDEAKGEIMYWLNPMDQMHNNYGWYTLADLKAWAKGKGPIPKK